MDVQIWKMERKVSWHQWQGRTCELFGEGDVTGGLPNQKWDPEALLRKKSVNQELQMRFQSTGNLKNYF